MVTSAHFRNPGTVPSAMDAHHDRSRVLPTNSIDLATLSTETIMGLAAASSRRMSCEAGLFVQYTGELGKREGWRAEGATSLEAWIVERCGVSLATARPSPMWRNNSRTSRTWPPDSRRAS